MAFDRGDVDRALNDIQKYLGYLKGNEQAYGYLERTWNQMVTRTNDPGIHVRQVMLRPDYRPPCPEARFRVNFTTWWHPVLCYPGGHEPDLKAYADEVQHQTDLAYGEGVAWAAGIAGYLRSICAQFVEPDVAVLREAVLDLQSKVVARLDDVLNDDWALLGSANEKWNGAAAGAFNSFYDNYNETLGRSGHFAGMVAIGFASATRVIESAQAGLQDFLDKTRDGLVEQLDAWVASGRKPASRPGPGTFPDWVVDLVKVADGVLSVASDVIPGATSIRGAVDTLGHVRDLVGDVVGLTAGDRPRQAKAFQAESCDQIYQSLADTLHDDFLGGCTRAMDRLDTGAGATFSDPSQVATAAFSGQAVLTAMKGDQATAQWALPDVPVTVLTGPHDHYSGRP